MGKHKIAPVEINGKTVWIEVEDVDIVGEAIQSANAPGDLRAGARPVGVISDSIKGKLEEIGEMMEAVVSTVGKGIDKVSPEEWSIEVSIGFAGEKQIPYLAKGSASGGVKVSAKWKK